MRITASNVGAVSAAAYTGLSLVVALAVFFGAVVADYGWVARVGAGAWTFFLAMIILMPIVIPLIRSWSTGEKMQLASHDHDAMLREQAARSSSTHDERGGHH